MGFLKKRELADSLYILLTTLAYARRKKSPVSIATLDISRALDSVNKVDLIIELREIRINSNILRVIYKIYSNT